MLVQRGVGCAIVTRGRRGSVWADRSTTGSCGAFPVFAIDTVAAGDAFCGGFAAALAEGHTFAESLRWGSAAGALAATVAGRGAVAARPRVGGEPRQHPRLTAAMPVGPASSSGYASVVHGRPSCSTASRKAPAGSRTSSSTLRRPTSRPPLTYVGLSSTNTISSAGRPICSIATR